MIQKAREGLEKEIDILQLVKSMRVQKMAMKRLIPAEEMIKLEERSQYFTIYPDAEGEDYRQTVEDSQIHNVRTPH